MKNNRSFLPWAAAISAVLCAGSRISPASARPAHGNVENRHGRSGRVHAQISQRAVSENQAALRAFAQKTAVRRGGGYAVFYTLPGGH